MPQEDSKICRKCSVKLNDENKVNKQNLCRTCNSRLCKEYKQNNKHIISDYNKKYKSEHKDEIKIYNHDYNLENRESIQKRQTKQLRDRRKRDIKYRITVNCRNKLIKCIKLGNSSFKLVGCTINFLLEWLKYNFTKEMTIENYGKYWHIDHVIPCSHFNMEDEIQKEICFHWTNLQPLEARENLIKNNTVNYIEVIDHLKKVCKYSNDKQINMMRQVKILKNISKQLCITTFFMAT